MKNQTNSEQNSQKAPNQKFFQELVESRFDSEWIKENLGDFKENKEEKAPEILKVEDKDKIKAYDEKEVKDLPKDWKAEFARLKELEKKLFDYEQKKEELKGWTDAFNEKKPLVVEGEIKDWEVKYNQTKQELESEKEQHILTTNKLKEWEQVFGNQQAVQIQQKLTELEKELKEWTSFWGDKEIEEVKKEWGDLQQRPDIAISEQTFYDDYARRLTLATGKKLERELKEVKELAEKYKEKSIKLWFVIGEYKKSIRIKKYADAPSMLTIKKAREIIAETLEKTEQEWKNYLGGTDKNPELNLSFWEEEKVIRARKILEQIEEARVTLDYQTLFERWSGGTEYNEEYDFDGSLFLLGKCLEVKEFEIPQLTS